MFCEAEEIVGKNLGLDYLEVKGHALVEVWLEEEVVDEKAWGCVLVLLCEVCSAENVLNE